MSGELDLARESIRNDELAAAWLIARSFLHDVRGFLTITGMCGAVGLESEDPEELREALKRIAEAERAFFPRAESFGRFLAGIAGAAPGVGAADLGAAAAAGLELAGQLLRRAGVTASTALGAAPAGLAPERASALALLAIVNAALVLDGAAGARISVATRTAGNAVALTIEARGRAVDVEGAIERSLSSSLDAEGRLARPALAAVRAIVESSGGKALASSAADGFDLDIVLPAARAVVGQSGEAALS